MSARQTKNCNQCMTEIHRRAKICPQCHQPITFLSGVKKLFTNTAWLLTTIVSLGLAARENIKKQEYASLAQEVLGLELNRASDAEASGGSNNIELATTDVVTTIPEPTAASDNEDVQRLQSRLETIELQLVSKLKNFAFDPTATKDLIVERDTIMRQIARLERGNRNNSGRP